MYFNVLTVEESVFQYVVIKSTGWWPNTAEKCSRWQLKECCSKSCVHSDSKYRH